MIVSIEETDIAAVTNPSFELFLILHISGSYEKYIKNHEAEFFRKNEAEKHSHIATVFHMLTGLNAKKNPAVGDLAERVKVAINQEKLINQDIHNIRGTVSSNFGKIIEAIINEKPEI